MTVLTAPETARVEQSQPMTRRIAIGMWRSRGGDMNEMISLAYMGLVEASQRWSEYCRENGYSEDEPEYWLAFLNRRVRGAIMDQARRVDHVPRSVRTRYKNGDQSVVAQVEARPVLIDDNLALKLRSPFSPESETMDRALPQALAAFIQTLPIDQRTVLALHYFAGLEIKEIAVYFGVPDSRVGQMHIKAVLAVHEHMMTYL